MDDFDLGLIFEHLIAPLSALQLWGCGSVAGRMWSVGAKR